MNDNSPIIEETQSDYNLSVRKTPVPASADFLPTFCQKSDQDLIGSFRSEGETFDKLPGSGNPTKKDKSKSMQKYPVNRPSTRDTRKTSAHNRNNSLSMTYGSNKRNDISPNSSVYNSRAASPARPQTAKNYRMTKSRDGSPIMITGAREFVDRRALNRSVELKALISEENKIAQTKSRTAGKVILDTKKQRKEIESQLSSLENRIKRLKEEEAQTLKKVEKVNMETEKALVTKMKKKEELMNKELRNKTKEDTIQKKRSEINHGRDQSRMSVSTAVLEMLKNRYINAQTLKNMIDDAKNREAEKRRLEDERKRAVKNGIKTWIQTSRSQKNQNDQSKQKEVNTSYVEKAKIEKERAQEIMTRCKQLQEVEKELMEKLNKTREMHKAKVNELKAIRSARVTDFKN